MINIRPVSDLKNKFQEIEKLVLEEEEEVYLTKNGYGSMVMMSLEKYCDLIKEIDNESILENVDIEKTLDEMEKDIDNLNEKVLNHEEVFSKLRKKINEQ